MALREILAAFDITVDDKQLKQLDTGLTGTIDKIKGFGGAVAGAFALGAIQDFIGGQIELGSTLNDTSERLGLSTTELQQFQFATGLAGVSAEEAATSLGFLNKAIGNAVGGNAEAAKSFADLKIKLKVGGEVRELGDIIPEVADAFVGMASDQERTVKAMDLFGRAGGRMLPFLKQGSAGITAMNAEFESLGGAIGGDFIKAADAAGDEVDKLKFATMGLKTQISIAVLPGITQFTSGLSKVIGVARQLFRETNIVKVGLAALGVAGVATGIKLASGLAKAFGFKAAGTGLMGTIRSLIGLGLVGGAIAAGILLIGLAVEDVYTMFTGGESIIGGFIDQLFGVGASKKYVEDVTASFEKLIETAHAITEVFTPIGVLFQEIFGQAISLSEVFKNAIRLNLDSVIILFDAIRMRIQLLVDAIKFVMKLASTDGILNLVAPKVAQSLKDSAARADVAGQPVFQGKETIGGIVPAAAMPFGPPRADNKISGPIEQTNHVQVTVQGGSTPQENGRAVAQGVRDALTGDAQAALSSLLTTGD